MSHHFQGRAAFLPLDILERVFLFAKPGPDDDLTEISVSKHAPINISQVCRNWRWVGLGRHKLWTTVQISADSALRLQKGVSHVEAYIARSGSVLPLTIIVFATADCEQSMTTLENDSDDSESRRANARLAIASMDQYMRLIEPVRHRLQNLQLYLPLDAPGVLEAAQSLVASPWTLDNMPRLEILDVAYPPIGNAGEPRTIDLSACSTVIRKCFISGCIKLCIAEGLVLTNLRHLSFDLVGSRDSALVASWYDVLRRAPRLRSLTVTICEGLDWSHDHDPITTQPRLYVDLPRLRKLCVLFSVAVEEQNPTSPRDFLDGLRCPRLRDLTLRCKYPNAPDERDPFAAHDLDVGPYLFLLDNGLRLERLVISCDLFYEYELRVALVSCINLRHLHFCDMRFADDSDLLKVLHLVFPPEELDEPVHAPCCPQLECLKVTNCYVPPTITKEDVASMIIGRMEDEESKLECFEFEGCGLEGVYDDPRIQAMCAHWTRDLREEWY